MIFRARNVKRMIKNCKKKALKVQTTDSFLKFAKANCHSLVPLPISRLLTPDSYFKLLFLFLTNSLLLPLIIPLLAKSIVSLNLSFSYFLQFFPHYMPIYRRWWCFLMKPSFANDAKCSWAPFHLFLEPKCIDLLLAICFLQTCHFLEIHLPL